MRHDPFLFVVHAGARPGRPSARPTEMRSEFPAVRQEIRDGDQETRRVWHQEIEATRQQLTAEIQATRQVLTCQLEALRHEFTGQIEETRRLMRVLHEEVIGRLAIIQEGQSRRRRKR